MITNNINITRNTDTGGYCCDFYLNHKKFYANVSCVFIPECMIFKYDEDDKIDWSGVYWKRNVTVSKESLLQCIKEFAEKECRL